jgi:hypothetical protein
MSDAQPARPNETAPTTRPRAHGPPATSMLPWTATSSLEMTWISLPATVRHGLPFTSARLTCRWLTSLSDTTALVSADSLISRLPLLTTESPRLWTCTGAGFSWWPPGTTIVLS